MSNYDFSYSPDRSGSGSIKWGLMKKQSPDVPKGIVPLSAAEMEFPVAPEIRDAMVYAAKTETPGYSWAYDGYYDAVIRWMETRHHWTVQREWIVPINGVVTAIDTVIDALGFDGCGVIIMTPVYYPFFSSSQRGGCHTVECPLHNDQGRYTINFERLSQLAAVKENRILILCSPHNPVGRVWTKEELHKIAQICLENDVYVISDEIHFDLILPGHTHTVFSQAAPEMAQKSIICTAPSKTFNMAGLETSNMIIQSEELRQKIEKVHHGAPSFFGYRACTAAYNEAGGWLDACLKVIDANAAYLRRFLAEKLPWITVSPLEGTYLMWLDLRACGLGKEELGARLSSHFLFLDEGYMFGNEGNGFERMAVAVPPQVLEQALDRLYEAFRDIPC